jgi:REP element-mobilizing transposase RayT
VARRLAEKRGGRSGALPGFSQAAEAPCPHPSIVRAADGGQASAMPVKHRNDAAGALHHVGIQGNDRRRIVLDEHDARTFALLRREAAAETGVTILSYADLDTHAHVYVRMAEPNLARFVQLFVGRYARAFNRRHGSEGHLVRSPFWSRRTTSEPQALMTLAYIALNPVRHGLCAHPREWKRGSYREIAGFDPPSGNVDVAAVRQLLGDGDAVRGRREFASLVDAWCRRVHERERVAHLPG